MPQIVCENLSLGYEGEIIVEDLNFVVEEGMYLCIVGENGAGKTTLMKTLLGLHSPLSGHVAFGDGLRQREIGYLSQQTDVQRDFPATVREIVLSGCQGRMGRRPFYNREDRKMAAQNMERLELTALAGRCYRELSGGQQQRVLLARALCATQKLIVLDEPVSGLDPHVTSEMYGLIRDLNREDGITVMMISHDITAALQEATHILHVGEDLFFGTKADYLASPLAARFLALKGGEPA